MIFTQVTLEVQTTVKKPNGAEQNATTLIPLQATKEKIAQSRLDEFSMIGLGKRNRYQLNAIGEYENLIFEYFYDEKNVKYKTVTWERNPKNNKMTLEGVVANGI
jgi:hypothetical protein